MRYVTACEHEEWHLRIWPKGQPDSFMRMPYRCRSWRHCGECRRWKGAQDFARIAEAIESRDHWTYCVLTFAQRDWPEPLEQYTWGVKLWSKVRLRLSRRYGKVEYIQTWERHKKGGAHVNLLVTNEEIHQAVQKDRFAWRRKVLEPMVVECGFGRRTWVEPLREGSGGSMAGYLVKLAAELIDQDNKGQIPFDAPPHFRRIRASRGLLPAVIKGDMTGKMEFSPLGCWEAWGAGGRQRVKKNDT